MLGKSPSGSFMVHMMTRSAEVLSAAGNKNTSYVRNAQGLQTFLVSYTSATSNEVIALVFLGSDYYLHRGIN